MSDNLADAIDLSDDEFEARLQDPSLIATHEEATAIIMELDAAIIAIQTQLDLYAIEAAGRDMPHERQSWFRRASDACRWRRNYCYRVMKRDREIRAASLQHQIPKDRVIKLAKEERLAAEIADRKLKREAEILKQRAELENAQSRRSIARTFQNLCKRRLPSEQYQALLLEAKALLSETDDA